MKYRFKKVGPGDKLTLSRYEVHREGKMVGHVERAISIGTDTDTPLWRSFTRDGFIQAEHLRTRRAAAQAIGVGIGNFMLGSAR